MARNHQDQGARKYILIEMADYFDTVLKPRIQKVAYAADWRDGKPVAGSAGQSHMFHYLRLESYEDTLNNLRFRSLDGPLFEALDAMPDYLLHYMLDYETGGSPSLLDVAQFERPFAYQLNITRRDVTEPRTIDLVTTFNFLLGLRVRTIRRFERDGSPVVRVTCEDPTGRRVCVLWRDVPPLEAMETEKAWLQAEALTGLDYDLLYINGESALPGSVSGHRAGIQAADVRGDASGRRPVTDNTLAPALLADIRSMIEEARTAVAATVNAGLTLLYWRIGQRINDEVLQGERAAYGRETSLHWEDSWRPSLVAASRRSPCGTWFDSLKPSPTCRLSHHC